MGLLQGDLQDQLAIFGRFQFEFSTGQLRKDGTRLRVEDKPARLLSLLLNRAGAVITREELQTLLWPDGVHVDYDHGLNNSVNKLRAVLSDDPDDPRFIETLPRLGYRFIGPVQIVENRKPAPAAASSESLPAVVPESGPAPSPGDSAIPRKDRSRNLLYLLRGAMALAVIIGTTAILLPGLRIGHSARRILASPTNPTGSAEIHALKIEKNGALDPLDEGFKLFRPDYAHYARVLYNRESNGWDR